MAKVSPALVNFNGGELGALMSGRSDFDKFASSCHRMRRFIPMVQGPAKRCPGTRMVIPVKDSTEQPWLIRFEFSFDQAYILEFGDQYVRFHTDRGTQLEASQNITGITQANPGVVTYAGADPSNGDWVYIQSVGGMTQVNGRYFMVGSVNAGANTFNLLDPFGDNVNTLGYTAYSAGGTMSPVYEIASPYTLADITNDEGACALSVTQSGDVLYIGCDGYQPRTLTRSGATSWAFATYDPSDGPWQTQGAPDEFTATNNTVGASVTITSVANLFEAAHVGMLLRIEPTDFSNTPPWEPGKAVGLSARRKSDGKFYTSFTAATTGTVRPIHEEGLESDGAVNWEYDHAGYGIVRITAFGSATSVTATVVSKLPRELVTPGTIESRYRFGAWGTATGAEYPHKVAFFRDRLWWGSDQNIYASVAGDYASHARDTVGQVLSDNAINLTVSIGSVDKIRWLKSAGDAMLIGTAGSEVALREITTTDPLGPDNVKFELQSAEGSREIEPIQVEDGVLFVRIGGRRILESRFDLQVDSWVPRDLNVLYPEITRAGIVDMAFQKEPDDILWCVLADGKLLGLTYDREQNVYGWHQHPLGGTDAEAEAVQVLTGPDGDVEDLWMVIKRTIAGEDRRYIEYFAQGIEAGDDVEGAVYLDSSLEYDGAVAATLTPGAGATVAGTTGVTFTAGSSVFVAGDIGREIRVRYITNPDDEPDEWVYNTSRAEITGYTSGTVVTAEILSAFQSVSAIASGGWRMTVTSVSGLHHLEGQTVSALADGSEVPDLVVSGGAVTLPNPSARVQVGLPYTSILATQRMEAGAADGTAQGKTKRIHRVVLRLYASLGGEFGPTADSLDDIPFRRASDVTDEVPPLATGDTESLAYPGGYETDARVWIVCSQPLPFTLAGIYPQLVTQDR